MRVATFVTVAHQPGLLQNSEMLRHGRLRDPGPSRQSPNRLLSVSAQSLEYRPPRGIGERSEEHIVSVPHGINNQLAINRHITVELCESQVGTLKRQDGPVATAHVGRAVASRLALLGHDAKCAERPASRTRLARLVTPEMPDAVAAAARWGKPCLRYDVSTRSVHVDRRVLFGSYLDHFLGSGERRGGLVRPCAAARSEPVDPFLIALRLVGRLLH